MVIGFLVGGVLVGRDLIKSYEIRAQIKQFDEFKIAATTFKLKYGSLPGDLPPKDTAQLGFFTFTGPYAGKLRLNPEKGYGNNDGIINEGEGYVFWQHLSQASMIKGNYGGSVSSGYYLGSDTSDLDNAGNPNLNVDCLTNFCLDMFLPKSEIGTFALLNFTEYYIYLFPNFYRSVSIIPNTRLPNIFIFYATSFQAYSIDIKIDDGLPDKGLFRDASTITFDNPLCVTSNSPNSYNLDSEIANSNACLTYLLW